MEAKFSIGHELKMPVVTYGDVPALFFHKESDDLPWKIEDFVLASKDLLNGMEPLTKIDNSDNREIYFSRIVKKDGEMPNEWRAVRLHFRNMEGGVSESGMIITVNPALGDDVKSEIKRNMNDKFMEALCEVVELPNNRLSEKISPRNHDL